MYIYVAVASILLFITVLHFVDKNNLESHKPPLEASTKVGLFILCVIITTVAGTILWDQSIPQEGGSSLNIQEIETGFPEF
jgi:hypothetical protein